MNQESLELEMCLMSPTSDRLFVTRAIPLLYTPVVSSSPFLSQLATTLMLSLTTGDRFLGKATIRMPKTMNYMGFGSVNRIR